MISTGFTSLSALIVFPLLITFVFMMVFDSALSNIDEASIIRTG